MTRQPLKIFIGGVPPGVRVGVFDERSKKNDDKRVIVLEEVAGASSSIETEVDATYGGVPVKVVVRCAGFLPYEYADTIEKGIGLFHAAHLTVDRHYSGNKHEIPHGWDASAEYRRAEREVQMRYRRFRKDNPRARRTKLALDWGVPLVLAAAGFLFDPVVGTLIGLVVGLVAGRAADRLASRAMGWD